MLNILIADDNIDDAINLMNYINENNTSVRVCNIARDGKQTIDILNNENNIDIILLDYQMPIYNGQEILEKIEDKSKYINSFIIISGEIESVTQIRECNLVHSILLKTLSMEDIKNRIIQLVEYKENIKINENINKKILIYIGLFLLITIVVGSIVTIIVRSQKNINVGKTETKDNIIENHQIEDNIVGEVSIGEGITEKDLSIPENLLDNNYTSIVKVKVLSVGEEATFLPRKEKFYNPYTPYTPINVEIIETINGDNLTGKMTIYMKGGKVKVIDVEKQVDYEEQEKMGDNIFNSRRKEKPIYKLQS